MDRTGKALDYPNMRTIPTYALYGEDSAAGGESWLHWETITSRSRLYGFHIAPHRHEQLFQLLYLCGGKAEVMVDGEVRTLRPPALIVVPPPTVHSYTFTTDVDGFVLTLFARDVQALLAESPDIAASLARPAILTDFEPTEIDTAVRRLVTEADRAAPGQMAALKARLMLLAVAIHRAGLAATGQGSGHGSRAEHLARSFQSLIDAHFRDTRSVAFYAEKLGITPTHLNRISRQVFSATALNLIERRILLEARRYLQFSTLSVKEIGIILGYDDPAYFSRFFSQRTGTTPMVFRTGALRAEAPRPSRGSSG